MFNIITIYQLRNALLLGVLLLALTACGGGESTPKESAVARSPTPVAISSTATPTPIVPTATPTPVPTPVVGDPHVSVPSPINPGEKIGISVAVDGVAGIEITYEWTHQEGKGRILDGQGTSGIIYRAPTEPGTYKIGVKITAPGTNIERSVYITVEKPPDTPTPTATDTPIPTPTPKSTKTPTRAPKPTDTPGTTEEPTGEPTEEPGVCDFIPPFRLPIEGPSVDVEASITSMENCTENLPRATGIPLRGTYSGNMTNKELWILVYPPDLRYYPQSTDACRELSAQFADEQWAEQIRLGRPDVAEAFHIVVVVTEIGSPASEDFHRYLRDGCDRGNWNGLTEPLPPGITELDSIAVHTQ